MAVADAPERAPETAGRALIQAYWTPRRLVWTVVVLGTILRAWVIASGWFYWDDYVFQSLAWRLPLGPDYLLHAHNGHFMPGAFLLQWPVTRLWPMNYLPLVVLLILGQALVGIAFARLALAIWGSRWQAAAAVGLVVLTPMTLPTHVWWAAAVNGVPFELALIVALSAGLRWWRSRRARSLLLAAVVVALALSFSEKVLVVPWVALAAAPLLDTARSALAVWREALRRTWWFWVLVVAGSAGYVVAYLTYVGKTPENDGTAAQIADLVGRTATTTLPTTMVGGPLRWQAIGFGAALAEPPWWLVAVAVEAMVLLLVVSSLRSRLARRAWAWAGAFVLLDLILVVSGRLNAFVDPEVMQGLRYSADTVIPLAIAVPIALTASMPYARRLSRLARRPGSTDLRLRAAACVVAVAVVVASVASTSSFREIWAANDSRAYVATAATSLAGAADGPSLVDQAVPAYVLYGLSYPYNQASWLLAPLAPRPAWGDPTTELRQLDDQGRLRPALIEGPANVPGPQPNCGYLVSGSADIPMQSRIIDWVFTVRVGYIASADGSATLAIGDGDARPVRISRGLHEVVLTLAGGGTVLRIRDLTPGVTLCTDEVRIGHPKVVTP